MDTDQFQNKHALANTINQLQPQKLSSNVWLGPLNSVAQSDFLAHNNIKYILGVMPSQKCCYYLRDVSKESFCCAAIDPNFNVQKLTEDEGELIMTFNTKFSPALSYLTNNKVSNAIITNLDFQKILDDFLEILRNIQAKDPQCGILLFSLNGNDNLLATFALAYIQDVLNCDVTSSFNYLKSIRPSIHDFDQLGFYSNEIVKYNLVLKSRKKFAGQLPTLKTKRSVVDITDHEEAERSSPRCLKRSM